MLTVYTSNLETIPSKLVWVKGRFCAWKAAYREDAERIIAAYLGKEFRAFTRRGVIVDVRETGLKGRSFLWRNNNEECWIAYMPDIQANTPLAPSRILCIVKKTGEIIYDGSEGGKRE